VEHWTEYSRFFTALFVILDPFAAIPIFLALTQGYGDRERRGAALLAAITVCSVLLVAALMGEAILSIMGTSLASFRVGGGIVLLLMALAMLRGDAVQPVNGEVRLAASQAIAVVPVAIPLLAGPGAISTVIIEMHRSDSSNHLLWIIGVILLLSLLLWLMLRLAERIGKRLGSTGLNILNRLLGLVLTAIAVEIMANGLRELFPALSG
jgi:multiple antibiotic resistance protein